METYAHQILKRMALAFLRQNGCSAVAEEVRCPICRYRADVALEMNGTWQLEIEARRPSGEAATLSGTLATGRAQIELESSGEASGEQGAVEKNNPTRKLPLAA